MGKSIREQIAEHGLEEHIDYLMSVQTSVLKVVVKEATNEVLGPNASRFNGGILMPRGVAPPSRDGKPLSHLAMIRLSDVHKSVGKCDLPSHGLLSFWYDLQEQPWGFDPADKAGFAVNFVPDELTELVDQRDALEEEFPVCALTFEKKVELPYAGEYMEGAPDGLLYSDEYVDLLEALNQTEETDHRLLGAPTVVQTPMEWECQMASNGIYIGDVDYDEKATSKLESGVADWRLLLQLSSDDTPGWMWGDCGRLYFWIRKQDLKASRFDRCWCVLQCV